ncbi:hypothetical protein CPC08DRAFT_536000 [Agrocybe pediades]|nr:hypothetical protein CPC08DRAFT_536000 [Agrocybe pediades]
MTECQWNEEDIDAFRNIMFRKWSAAAALALLLYEYAITCGDEFTYIWRRQNFNSVGGVYLFSRYFAIITQSINLFLVAGVLGKPGTPHRMCRGWYSFQITAASLTLAALDYILMLRVYALYNRSPKIGFLLVFFFLSMLMADFQCGSKTLNTVSYDSICNGRSVHPCIPFYGIALWSIHITIGMMTAAKWRLLTLGAPIARIVSRDGAFVLSIICVFYASIMERAISMQALRVELTFIWPISLLSITCCRMIMNMQTVNVPNFFIDNDRSIPVFTSDVDLICMEQEDLVSRLSAHTLESVEQ